MELSVVSTGQAYHSQQSQNQRESHCSGTLKSMKIAKARAA